ncbi:TPA: type I-E CRISPR-associated protein Cse1/CasA [Escherichia coli]|nr:type I-E CRISPR-associated protein Cse1/CasA [Escherichia coli]HBA4383622.1 type I-E CRISPR-associated protein Cse1/CasA [Escherichia coli]HBB1779086.1 type I-E CRISPR-associated protein Cse1/CasA [Escherichia coli]
MNSFSLLTTPWLPVRFKDGTTGKLAPVDLADENVVDIAAPRADLQGAAWQFLLGLLQTSFAPKNHGRWDDIWQDGLEAEKLREALLSLEHAFQFGADSPSFMQDFEALKGDKVQVASLLPEIPGAQTTKFNKDHFIKRGVRGQAEGSDVWLHQQQAALDWLAAQGERSGFTLLDTSVDAYRQQQLRRENSWQLIQFSSVDYTGMLTVTDPGLFLQRLSQGYGKSRAFGCGLMLIKPGAEA